MPSTETIAGVTAMAAAPPFAASLLFFWLWRLSPNARENRYWAASYLAFATSILAGSASISASSQSIGMFSLAAFVLFIVMQTVGNFIFTGQGPKHLTAWSVGGGAALVIVMSRGADADQSLWVSSAIVGGLFIWNGWLVRNSIRVGRILFLISIARGIMVAVRPGALESEFFVTYSFGSQTLFAIYVVLLLMASLLKERQLLIDAEKQLFESFEQVSRQAAEIEILAESYRSERDQARKADRAKADFIANMNHELRTPLNAVIGFADLMIGLGERIGEAKRIEYLSEILKAGNQQLRHVEALLELSRVDSGRVGIDLEDVPLSSVVSKLVTSHHPAANVKSVEIIVENSDDALRVQIDESLAKKAIGYVLENAVAAAPIGSKVEIHLSKADDEQVCVSIRDYGDGVVDSFEVPDSPFAISDDVYTRKWEGLGLGLYLTKRLLEFMDAKILVSRTDGPGTLAQIFLKTAHSSAANST